jgi:heat shock protein HtpX
VYEQIAHNKRRTVLYIGVFFLVWLGIGAVVGTLYDAFSPGPVGAPSLEPLDLIVGIILAAVLAAAATAFTLRSGALAWCCPWRERARPSGPRTRSSTTWSSSRAR